MIHKRTLFFILILFSQFEFIDLLKHFEGVKAMTNDDDEKVYRIQLVTEAANFLCRKHWPVLSWDWGHSDMLQIIPKALAEASCV